MSDILSDAGLDLIFRNGRTFSGWLDKPVSDVTLMALFDLLRLGPTSMNCSPARIVFVRSPAAKERLKPALSPGNVDKTMAAPVTAIVGSDLDFADRFEKLWPPNPAAAQMFRDNVALNETTAFRNSTLQGAYLIVAARSLGLDCGPMSGFDNAKVDAAFFAGSRVRSNFLCNIGYGDRNALRPRNPRLDFAEACRIE